MTKKIAYAVLLFTAIAVFSISCQKEIGRPSAIEELEAAKTAGKNNPENGHLKQTKSFSADVVQKWLAVQVPMLYTTGVNPYGIGAGRMMAYCGVALYESVVPGMPAYQSLAGQLNEMPAMPGTEPGKAYHWPTCANAALAEMTRKLFGSFYTYNAGVVNGLENELNTTYETEIDNPAIFSRSVDFGKAVADKIFAWSTTDRPWLSLAPNSYAFPAYVPGLWRPENGATTLPNGIAYWGDTRTMVPGSIDNSASAPNTYSEDPNSPYYKDMQEVYNVSKILSHDQKLQAIYYDDPALNGYPAGASYTAVLKQVMEQLNPSLDIAALAFAKAGMSLMDATIGSLKSKFADNYNTERPFQFIRRVIEPSSDPATWWKPLIPTPGHPDFPSNHAVFSASFAHALTSVFGDNISFSNNTYAGKLVDLGNGPEDLGTRYYTSFYDMSNDISFSRLYGGIHTRYACEEGMNQGKKIAQNIDTIVEFLK